MSKPKARVKSAKKPAKPRVPDQRVHLFFTGRVQGVGFRHTTEEIALRIGLVGWVRNLHDGRVEVIAEGGKDGLDEFLENLSVCHLGPHIKKREVRWEKPTGEFNDFCVEFCF